MSAFAKTKVMDWSRFTFEDWLKQYGAWISVCRMRGGHEPDQLEINQIYWLVREKEAKIKPNSKQVIIEITEFEALQVEKKIFELRNTKLIPDYEKRCVSLFVEKWVRGLSLDQMDAEFKLSRSSINNMIYAGEFYIAGHDKKLMIKKKLAFK
ncbi:hypothetical protein QR665_14700 [Acinetobacter gerneri]|uniref:hypothetical protein n=1 Tax=Acinetobacter gerneri TaxID=202952 RepID=UPI002935BE31|nr:hypothetical protein [Acinetobacter gerneri]MDV2440709.1 hypothetical protein [Acinetobacter gerneri]